MTDDEIFKLSLETEKIDEQARRDIDRAIEVSKKDLETTQSTLGSQMVDGVRRSRRLEATENDFEKLERMNLKEEEAFQRDLTEDQIQKLISKREKYNFKKLEEFNIAYTPPYEPLHENDRTIQNKARLSWVSKIARRSNPNDKMINLITKRLHSASEYQLIEICNVLNIDVEVKTTPAKRAVKTSDVVKVVERPPNGKFDLSPLIDESYFEVIPTEGTDNLCMYYAFVRSQYPNIGTQEAHLRVQQLSQKLYAFMRNPVNIKKYKYSKKNILDADPKSIEFRNDKHLGALAIMEKTLVLAYEQGFSKFTEFGNDRTTRPTKVVFMTNRNNEHFSAMIPKPQYKSIVDVLVKKIQDSIVEA